ncbi:hypothetical protein M5689_020342 [Euphorbia peplus]|nr:hypothetical protein M5689_020342 [Euphorbia peplus]
MDNWPQIFITTCWLLGKWRNLEIFEDKDEIPFQPSTLVLRTVREFKDAWSTLDSLILTRRMSIELFGWGDIIRNSDGEWVAGFIHNIDIGSSFEAELWGLFSGIGLAVMLNIRLLQVESDNKEAVDFVSRVDHLPGRARNLVLHIRRMLVKFDAVEIVHVYREQNSRSSRCYGP